MAVISSHTIHASYDTPSVTILKNSKISCLVCKKSICFTKYRRHMQLTHVKHKQLSEYRVEKIEFRIRKIQ